MQAIPRIYRLLADHIGKLLASFGASLMALDLAGQGDRIKEMADSYLGAKGAQKVGVILFALTALRFFYASYVSSKKQAQIEALQARVDSLSQAKP